MGVGCGDLESETPRPTPIEGDLVRDLASELHSTANGLHFPEDLISPPLVSVSHL